MRCYLSSFNFYVHVDVGRVYRTVEYYTTEHNIHLHIPTFKKKWDAIFEQLVPAALSAEHAH